MGKRGPKPTYCRICGLPSRGHRLCGKHYKRWYRYGDPLLQKHASPGEAHQFLERAVKYRGTKCLLWPFGKSNGYAAICTPDRKMHHAHTLVCERVYGPIPGFGYEAAHKCGVRECVNPRHLYWATFSQNKGADVVRHGKAWWLNPKIGKPRLIRWRRSMRQK